MMLRQLPVLQENYFAHGKVLPWEEIPPADEAFVQAWEGYLQDCTKTGVLAGLRKRLVQLNFPVQQGMASDPEYRLAARRGLVTAARKRAKGTELNDPANLKTYLYQTFAGRIPVLETGNRKDFETLVRAFAHSNEPVEIPASMGACMIKGYNNWDRVAQYKRKLAENFDFTRLKAQKELYQDSFLILTDSEYSGVPAEMLGLSPAEWRKLSKIIRIEHEATHYCTLRILGSARNHLLDEFIADYLGIVSAAGRYRARWFLCFMGLESYPDYRKGGRLANYIKNLDLSPQQFNFLKTVVKTAAENGEKIFNKYHQAGYSEQDKYLMFLKLTKMNLLQLASDTAEEYFDC
ncbi:MAG: DUF7005 family protein [Peptococcaceae bacterium]